MFSADVRRPSLQFSQTVSDLSLFLLQGQDLVVRHFLSSSLSAREAVLALAAANKYRWRVIGRPGSAADSGSTPVDNEAFPMGYRGHTQLEDGWVDLACGPSISLSINYTSRNHDSVSNQPHTLHIDISAPHVLLRAFAFLATDLLGLKVSCWSVSDMLYLVQ